jgi:hypothetical protein
MVTMESETAIGTLTILQEKYADDGTEDSPFRIDWLDYDPENRKKWMNLYKCFLILVHLTK